MKFDLILFLTIGIVTLVSAQQTQFLRAYNGTSCSGTALVNTGNSGNVTINANVTSLSVAVNGLWHVHNCINTVCNGNPVMSGTGNCRPLVGSNNTNRLILTRYGDPNQMAQQLQIYQDRDFNGGNQIISAATAWPTNFNIRSYHFTGNHTWGLYPNANFTGVETCLRPQIGNSQWGITFHDNTVINIRSARPGCNSTTTPPTTPRITTTTRKPNNAVTIGLGWSAFLVSVLGTFNSMHY